MKTIQSFTVDHDFIDPGMYISRIDGDITTYDMRTRKPNCGDYMDNITMHSLEHMFATYIRNSAIGDSVIYFGPMGCRTGCYILMFGDLTSDDIVDMVLDMCDFIISFEGDIPGAAPEQCGNYSEQNLNMAKYYISKYKKQLSENRSFEYTML